MNKGVDVFTWGNLLEILHELSPRELQDPVDLQVVETMCKWGVEK